VVLKGLKQKMSLFSIGKEMFLSILDSKLLRADLLYGWIEGSLELSK